MKKEIPQPLHIIQEGVSPIIVGKYYLKAELDRLFPGETPRAAIDERVNTLEDKEFWRLLEALSFSFRLNGMFWIIGNEKYTWNEEEWRIADLTFIQMGPTIDRVSFSKGIEGNTLTFRDYLQEYFLSHPFDDPEDLGQFRPNGQPINYPKLFLVEDPPQVKLIDGGNRLIAASLKGEESITAYIGRATTEEGMFKIGDSTFWLLRNIYQKATPEEREVLIAAVKILIQRSSDGRAAIQTYWVDHVSDKALKEVGESLL